MLERARRGDEQAFSALFARYQRSIYRYAAYMCGRDSADDVVQDTFLAVLRQSGREDVPRAALGSYLIGIARHLVIKRMAGHASARIDDLDELDGAAAGACIEPAVFDAMVRAQTIDAVRAAIHALPAAYREAVVLCDLQEIPYAEAATLMQVPVGTVRSRLHRGRALLAARLSPVAVQEG